MPQPALSIIMPVYNAADHLGQALDSILNQDFKDYEIILIDGGSTDGTRSIIEKHQALLTYWQSEKDKGIYDAMNKGIAKASGQWLYFMGADDVLADGAVLQSVFSDKTAPEVQIKHGMIENVNRQSKKVPRFHETQFSSLLYWKNCMHHQGVFYRADLFNKIGFNPSYRVLADYDLNIFFYRTGVHHLHIPLLIARSDAAGISKKFNTRLYVEELKIKSKRLPLGIFFLNLPWVLLKFIYKNLPEISFRKRKPFH